MDINLKRTAFARRLDVLEMVYKRKAGHIGGSMSCMDILVSLYYGLMDVDKIKEKAIDRDRFILSKGHCAEALYAVLADVGFFEKSELSTFTVFKTRLAEHPTYKIPGIEIATGALGHGLSAGVGMALGQKCDGIDARVYVLMGDGELAEGSVWEALMCASKYELGNLFCFVDRNHLQISGGTEEVMPLEGLSAKFEAFGFETYMVNGHDAKEIIKTVRGAVANGAADKPKVLLCETVKGYGSAIIENQAPWHHSIPNDEQYHRIRQDLLDTIEREVS